MSAAAAAVAFSGHASVRNHFNHQRNIDTRARFKSLRNAALLEWRELSAA